MKIKQFPFQDWVCRTTKQQLEGEFLMKKAYEAPQLLTHGSIEKITEISQDSNSKDFLFGPPSASTIVIEGVGSFDACIIDKQTKQCL
jgi:hypothetical protein